MIGKKNCIFISTVLIAFAGGLLVWAQEKKEIQESEREVKEAEVPAVALAALKKLAGAATITEFAEEIEHGHKFYEGSWQGPEGKIDGLVTEAGDVVEIEEKIAADKVPATAKAAIEKEAGKDASIHFEKKTFFVYEAHFKKDGQGYEVIYTPDGRRYHEEGEHDDDTDEDEKD
ncbi:MAG: hypothetical protein HJJLKODD_00320 [Phycisphaerae bacterium]|nr:hypothetical protein [Phycisphaerae bacterium]